MDAGQTQGNADYVELRPVTGSIIGAAIDVNRKLGMGFVEKVYENALLIELRKLGLDVEQQRPIEVRYDNQIVGAFVADLVVEGRVVVELKVASHLHSDSQIQCLNYLRATGLNVRLLLNFGRRRLEYKRFVMTHSPPCVALRTSCVALRSMICAKRSPAPLELPSTPWNPTSARWNPSSASSSSSWGKTRSAKAS